MNWRGSTSVRDRIFAVLPYTLPLIDSLAFGSSLFSLFPPLALVFLPLAPFIGLYSLPFVSLAIFFALFLLVVRNESISHFIRFNTMQALLIDIVLVLCRIIMSILFNLNGLDFIAKAIANCIFIGVMGIVIYAVVQSLRGLYAEIPTLSDAVYMQVR